MVWLGILIGVFIGSIGTGIFAGRITDWFKTEEEKSIKLKLYDGPHHYHSYGEYKDNE